MSEARGRYLQCVRRRRIAGVESREELVGGGCLVNPCAKAASSHQVRSPGSRTIPSLFYLLGLFLYISLSDVHHQKAAFFLCRFRMGTPACFQHDSVQLFWTASFEEHASVLAATPSTGWNTSSHATEA